MEQQDVEESLPTMWAWASMAATCVAVVSLSEASGATRMALRQRSSRLTSRVASDKCWQASSAPRTSSWNLRQSSEEDDDEEDELDLTVSGIMAWGALVAPSDVAWKAVLETSPISVGQS